MENDPIQIRKNGQWEIIERTSSMMADDIKNPLNAIKLNADILLESREIPEAEKDHLRVIVKEVRRLNRLVKDVLALSREYELIPTECDLRNIIDRELTSLRHDMDERHICVAVDVPSVKIRVDAERMQQVMFHLLSNAIEAINQNGTIKISGTDRQADGSVSVQILDDGPGVENEDRLFEPFFTTKRTKTGLGLPISQRIIEQHGGTLELFSSRPGETIFRITLREGLST
ncbi:MAG: ATP-binding protein [Ignavibacteriales bacterium]|nr:ATP-binding protein [Ignavibacteriales bacterium]